MSKHLFYTTISRGEVNVAAFVLIAAMFGLNPHLARAADDCSDFKNVTPGSYTDPMTKLGYLVVGNFYFITIAPAIVVQQDTLVSGQQIKGMNPGPGALTNLTSIMNFQAGKVVEFNQVAIQYDSLSGSASSNLMFFDSQGKQIDKVTLSSTPTHQQQPSTYKAPPLVSIHSIGTFGDYVLSQICVNPTAVTAQTLDDVLKDFQAKKAR